MSIPAKKIYPRTGDTQTVYLNQVISNANTSIGEYTMYNDFVQDPLDFEKNNVWIGYEAIILSGVHIGDGAIIGARSVVTKDVEPYTIVGGAPAKPIRKRFQEEIVQKLQKLQWWEWPYEKIKEKLPNLMSGNIDSL